MIDYLSLATTLALVIIAFSISRLVSVIRSFHADFRRVNDLDVKQTIDNRSLPRD